MPMTNDSLSVTLSALADPTRRAILARLSQGEATVNELAEPFDISLPSISRHLKVLEGAGLITRGREAQWRPCKLETEPLKQVDGWLERYRQVVGRKLRQDGCVSNGDHQGAGEREEAVSELRDDELLIEREFDAPVAARFPAVGKPRSHAAMVGPEKFTAIEMDWELTPGRPWRGAMASKQYGLSRFGGVIREVEKNRRIVFTFQWDEEFGARP